MSRELDALRSIVDALDPLDQGERERIIDWLHAYTHNTTQDRVRVGMRIAGRIYRTPPPPRPRGQKVEPGMTPVLAEISRDHKRAVARIRAKAQDNGSSRGDE